MAARQSKVSDEKRRFAGFRQTQGLGETHGLQCCRYPRPTPTPGSPVPLPSPEQLPASPCLHRCHEPPLARISLRETPQVRCRTRLHNRTVAWPRRTPGCQSRTLPIPLCFPRLAAKASPPPLADGDPRSCPARARRAVLTILQDPTGSRCVTSSLNLARFAISTHNKRPGNCILHRSTKKGAPEGTPLNTRARRVTPPPP